jgi:alpha,alpha-trehalose phosphorylase
MAPSKGFRSVAQYNAALFDLDGVLTPTIILHKAAWKELFDDALPASVPPYTEQDYFTYVDGKPRYDGVASLLQSRNIELPWGSPGDDSEAQTVCGLGNRKNAVFEKLLHEQGIAAYDDVVDVLRHLKAAGLYLAVVSSSRNAVEVLETAGIIGFFDRIVDGTVRSEQDLRGKPAPDTYVYAAKMLGIAPDQAVVIEDALSGVAAGSSGGFGLVIGVDRGVGRDQLLKSGADIVVTELAQMIDGSYVHDYGRVYDPERIGDPLSEIRNPVHPWAFVEVGPPNEQSGTLFSLSNGAIGIRGAGDDQRRLGFGTFLSGYHETFPIRHAEGAYGYAQVGQVIQGVPDATDYHFLIDGVPLEHPVNCAQQVDFRTGIAQEHREYQVEDLLVQIDIERMVCLFNAHLAVSNLTVRVNKPGTELIVRVEAPANNDLFDMQHSDDPRKMEQLLEGGLHEVERPPIEEAMGPAELHAYRCVNSHMGMAMGSLQTIDGRPTGTSFNVVASHDEPAHATRYIAYHTDPVSGQGIRKGLVLPESRSQNTDELIRRCEATLRDAAALGESALLDRQREWLDAFWKDSDIEVALDSDRVKADGKPTAAGPDSDSAAADDANGADSTPAGSAGAQTGTEVGTLTSAESDNAMLGERIQQIIRWELFQLAQTTAFVPNGVAAKGLSGSGYSGHYFWDTETFVLPFLTYTRPDQARDALSFRHRMLPAARKRAAAMSVDGALFPWRTINGEEASAFFPASTAQYHIDADIAYAVMQYVGVSGDWDYLGEEGIDILVETARMWADLGRFGKDGRFHINCVTGPDEYTTLVDDNFYTNAMAQFNLSAAADALEHFDHSDPRLAAKIRQRLHIRPDELGNWRSAASAMSLPQDPETGLHLQDSQFLHRVPWNFEREAARPLLLHYHPMEIYRHQVLKQTDTVLALFMLSSHFSLDEKKTDFDVYDPLTTGDSTLSLATQAIIAAEVGYRDKAYAYFLKSLFTDVADLHYNTSDGIHLAAAGGIWGVLVDGFGGLRDSGGETVCIDPRLPHPWRSMRYRIAVHGSKFEVLVTRDDVSVTRISGDPVDFRIQGQLTTV